jgi:hypothetical protein
LGPEPSRKENIPPFTVVYAHTHSPERLPDTGIISPGAPDALWWGRIAPAKMPGYRPNTNSIDAVDKFFSSGAGLRWSLPDNLSGVVLM